MLKLKGAESKYQNRMWGNMANIMTKKAKGKKRKLYEGRLVVERKQNL